MPTSQAPPEDPSPSFCTSGRPPSHTPSCGDDAQWPPFCTVWFRSFGETRNGRTTTPQTTARSAASPRRYSTRRRARKKIALQFCFCIVLPLQAGSSPRLHGAQSSSSSVCSRTLFHQFRVIARDRALLARPLPCGHGQALAHGQQRRALQHVKGHHSGEIQPRCCAARTATTATAAAGAASSAGAQQAFGGRFYRVGGKVGQRLTRAFCCYHHLVTTEASPSTCDVSTSRTPPSWPSACRPPGTRTASAASPLATLPCSKVRRPASTQEN